MESLGTRGDMKRASSGVQEGLPKAFFEHKQASSSSGSGKARRGPEPKPVKEGKWDSSLEIGHRPKEQWDKSPLQ